MKSLQTEQIAQIYYYEPQSAGINVQSPQSESTPRRLTLAEAFCSKNSSRIPVPSTYSSDKILAGEVTEYQIKCYLHPLFTFAVFYLWYFSTFLVGNLSSK